MKTVGLPYVSFFHQNSGSGIYVKWQPLQICGSSINKVVVGNQGKDEKEDIKRKKERDRKNKK
jgi:hypothetical protein